MRHIILVTIMLISGSAFAQISTIKPTCSEIWLTTYSTSNRVKGKLVNVDQDNVSIILPQSASHPQKEIRSIHISDIHQLSLRDTKQVGRSALYGALTGAIVGMVGGLVVHAIADDIHSSVGSQFGINENPSPWRTVLGYGAAGALTGSVIGTIVGSAKWTITINGDQGKLDQHRKKLQSSICIK